MAHFSDLLRFLLFSATFLLTLFLSGNAVLILTTPRRELLPVDLRIPLAMASGLSLIPICLLWTSTLGVRLSATFAYLYVGAAILVNVLSVALRRTQIPGRSLSLKGLWEYPHVQALACLAGVFFLTWITRFITVRGFLVAPGSDSYHHTLISTLIAEQGRIPTSYEPYAPPSSFTYHFGFHALTAFMYWLTHIPLTKLVLWTGQAINSLVVLSMYFLAKRLTGHVVTAVIASFLVGLVSVFPAYMVNWSRFTQLSGLVLLTLVIGLFLVGQRAYYRHIPLLVGAMFLYHYRVFAMFGLLLAVTLIISVAARILSKREIWKSRQVLGLTLAVVVGLLIVAPWLIRILWLSPLSEFANSIYSTASQSDALRSYYDLSRLEDAPAFYSIYWMLLLSVIGLVSGILKHGKVTLVWVMWAGLLLLLSNPYWLPVPGAGLIDLNTVIMSSFVFVCFFAALGVVQLVSEGAKVPAIAKGGAWGGKMAVAGIIVFAVIKMVTIADPDSVYVRANDLRAMEWIRTHTDTSAKFLINPAIFGWSPTAVTGNDAGYWLPLLAGRQTTILPMVVTTERVNASTLAVMSELSQMATSPNSSTLSTLKREEVSHVFIGERGGPIPVSLLENTDCVAEVWRRGRTRVFQLDYGCIE